MLFQSFMCFLRQFVHPMTHTLPFRCCGRTTKGIPPQEAAKMNHHSPFANASKLLHLCLLSILFLVALGNEEDESCTTPPPFDDDTKQQSIYIVMSVTTGDFFIGLAAGAGLQALGIGEDGVNVVVFDAEDDFDKQADLVSDAAGKDDVVGILTTGGSSAAMCGAISNAIEKSNIPVVSFDLDGGACSATNHVLTSQFDDEIASLVLDQALENQGKDVNVGYVSDLNFSPLVIRDTVWQTGKAINTWREQFFVQDAAAFSNATDLQTAIEQAILGTSEPIDFIYGPWDYLSLTILDALNATGVDAAVYGADINDFDIMAMTAPNSQWKATAGASPYAIGAGLIRMVSLLVANELDETDVRIPSTLITQEFLLNNSITNMDELTSAKVELTLPNFTQACWISTPFEDDSSDNPDDPPDDSSSFAYGFQAAAASCVLIVLLAVF